MTEYREPIKHLTEEAVLKQRRVTQSVVSAWLARMVDAGWVFTFGEDGVLFRHSDDRNAVIDAEVAQKLVERYWESLHIPTQYNYKEMIKGW